MINNGIYSQLLDTNEYTKGIVLIGEGDFYSGEFKKIGEDTYLRNQTKGRLFKRDEVKGFISQEYYDKIKSSSPLESMWNSLLYFDSSATYQWSGKENSIFIEDFYTRVIKISLLLMTGYLFLEANKANDDIKSSYLGFNDSSTSKFQKRYEEYQIAAGLTIGYFAYSSIKAYVRFGRDGSFNDMNLMKREFRSMDYELNSDSFIKDKYDRIDFLAEKKF
jgi:hypothetical protein